jgi:calcium/calmodulin-dependent protein kinase I
MGVITYILLSGYPPFHSDNDAKILEQTLSGKFQYFSPEWDSVSKNAKDFINNLIVVGHKVRMTVDQVLAHPWLDSEIKRREGKTVTDEESISLPQVGANLKKNFNARKKMTSLIQAVSFMTKLQLKDGFKLDSRLNSQNGSQDGSKPETPKGDFDPTKEQKLKDIEAVKARLDQIADNQASKQEKI